MYLLWDQAGMKGGWMGVGEGGGVGGHLDRMNSRKVWEDLHVTVPHSVATKSAVCVKTSPAAPCIEQWRPDLCHNHLLMRLAHNPKGINKYKK